MKKLMNFEEFLNESQLNEALEGPQKSNAKKIGDLTKSFLEKDLPGLLSRYNSEVAQLDGAVHKDDFLVRNGGEDLFKFSTWCMGRNRHARIIAYLDTTWASLADPYKKQLFLIGSPSDADSKVSGIGKMISGWQYGPYVFLDDASSVKIYQDWIDSLLKGMEGNLELLKSKNVLK